MTAKMAIYAPMKHVYEASPKSRQWSVHTLLVVTAKVIKRAGVSCVTQSTAGYSCHDTEWTVLAHVAQWVRNNVS
jgi:hypothetical protein